MSESSPQAAPPAAPAHDAPEAGFFGRLDRAVEHVTALTHSQGPAVAAVAEEVRPLLHGHAAAVFDLGRRVFTDPELRAIAPDVLELVITAAKIAGVAL